MPNKDRQEYLDEMREALNISIAQYASFVQSTYDVIFTTANNLEVLEDLANEFCDRYEKDLNLQNLYETLCEVLEREPKVSEDDV